MKAFIDLGAYHGDTTREFFNWIQLIDDPSEYEVWAFEPNPDLLNHGTIAAKKNNYTFKPWAAWTFDGQIEMAIDKTQTPMGSTVMESKTAIWDAYPHVKVKCFDFSKWLSQKFTEDDQVIVKMDIEGAEYPVLEKMLKDGIIGLPQYLFVEFHPNKVKEYTGIATNDLVDRIIKAGGNLKLWH